nr:T cell receptor beta [Andrias davidianus]
MQGTCSLFALTLLFHYGRALSIDQRPRFLSLSPGKAVRIECSVQGYASPYMYWYRTFPKKPFEMMFLSRVKDQVDDSPEKHFSATRTTSQDFILETESVSLNDTAEYYCAWGDINTPLYFGQGTKLTVLEDGIPKTSPTVVLFDPSPQEIKDKGKATLVCLANKFYPDHVTMGWSVNGVERTAGVKTDDSPTRDNASMYFLSSRLRLSKKEWLNPQNTFRCTVHFHSPEASIPEYRETKGREECGMTPDSFRKSANTGKFTYVLLLAKSAFYGLFVTLLVWKMKPPGEKQLF